MDMPKNEFKAALGAGQRQIGMWCSIGDTAAIEMLAGCGYDWLLIDSEHTAVGLERIMQMMQAVAPYAVSAVVRPGWNDPVEIKRLLDCGAQSILVPYVQSADEAKAAVAAVRYPPKGIRGVAGMTRASRYGAVKEYAKRAESEICLLVQIETAAALAELEAIAAVDGVDGIFIGPADLAASMGFPGEPSHPEVRAAILDAMARIAAAGLPAGFLSFDESMLRDVDAAGCRFIAIGADMAFLRQRAIEARKGWQ